MVSVTNNKLMWSYSARDCLFKKSVFTKHSEIYIESQPQLTLFHLVKNNIYSHFKNVYPSLPTTVLLLADRCQIFIMFKDYLRNRNLSINIILFSGRCSDSYSTDPECGLNWCSAQNLALAFSAVCVFPALANTAFSPQLLHCFLQLLWGEGGNRSCVLRRIWKSFKNLCRC